MFSKGNPGLWRSLKCLLGLACAAGIAPAAASAQEGRLSVQASPQVIYSGQSAKVNVFAHFTAPPAPNAPYAFASAQFDVHATDPRWTFASDGQIIGSSVTDIAVGQAHQPHQGIFADPSNPFRLWSGVLEPQSQQPVLMVIDANTDWSYVYPSKWTSSTAMCDTESGRAFILVNPLRAGRWLAAPGPGTRIDVQDDVIVDGRIITGENGNSVKIGTFICPSDPRPRKPAGTTGRGSFAIRLDDTHPRAQSRNGDDFPVETVSLYYNQVRASSTRLEFDRAPESFAVSVQSLKDGPAGGLHFERVEFNLGGQVYVVGANGSTVNGPSRFKVYSGDVEVASGDLAADGQIPGLVVSAVPQTIGAHLLYQDTYIPAGVCQSLYGGMALTLRYDQPVVAIVLGPNGNPVPVTGDWIEFQSFQQTTSRPTPSSHAGLGCHVFEATGVERMTLVPRAGE